jgi:hypothetical protein
MTWIWWAWIGMSLANEEEGTSNPAPAERAPAEVGTAPKLSRDRFWYSNQVFARVNPLGLQDMLRIGYRREFSRPGRLFQDTYLLAGASVNLSPAFVRAGPHIEVQPLALFRLEAAYQAVGWFGVLDQLTPFPGSDVDFSDNALDALPEQSAFGHLVMLGGRVQAAVGPVIVRNIVEFNWYDADLPTGSVAFYEQFWDRLVLDKTWMVRNDTDVIVQATPKIKTGVRYTYSDSFVGDGSSGDAPHHRVGPIFAYEFFDKPQGTRFDKPTLFVLAQWWLAHPYRAGQQQPQALPLIAAGLTFEGDMFGPKPEELRPRARRAAKRRDAP